ncbi:FAD/NAD(P)-binding protein [Nocardioides sp. MAHUQ-72]|uniref:FAD/NAD(P)-binding protein n=1 Tax=unclassified Nocardioides TaxID=2615069 RepID=UPI003621A393
MPVEAAVAPASEALLPRPFRVAATRRDTRDTVTLELESPEGPGLPFAAGQFTMLQTFGSGEVPISISGDPGRPERLVHTIRDVGGVTRALCEAREGDVLGVRGPFGRGWGVADGAGGDLVVVAGGIGLAPLRPAVLAALAGRHRFGRIRILLGARTEEDVLFPGDLEAWGAAVDVDVAVIVDRAATSWTGRVGLVTELVRAASFDAARTLALVCGPEVMMRYVAADLVARGVPADRVRLSLERNMRCGVGLCGHCQLREHLLCVDGPVLSLDRVLPHLTVREL